MARTYALGLITAAAASLSTPKCAYADGPFSFSPFSSPSPSPSPNAPQPPSPVQSAPSKSPADAEPPPPPKVRNDYPRTTSAGFDPDPLERGAKYAKDISNSKDAKKVRNLGVL